MKPHAIILSGYGLNCEDETAFAFRTAGAEANIVHINDLIAKKNLLKKYQILAVPGGFSFGDDTGSGKAYANKLKACAGEIAEFVNRDTLTIGICNGFQILTGFGLLPGALTFNDSARYISRWVDIAIEPSASSPWLLDINTLSLPIAHGEGKYWIEGKKPPTVAARYYKGKISTLLDLPYNPNGSLQDIAGILGYNGRVLGMMPHPERAQFSWQQGGHGINIFKNAIRYFN